MDYLGISYDYRNKPSLEPAFIPFAVWEKAYLAGAERPFKVAVERDHGNVSVFSSRLRGEEFEAANYRYMERFVKFLLWSAGGLRVTICGCEETVKKLQAAYTVGGARDFDWHFMDDIFESGFEIVLCDEAHFPAAKEQPKAAGGHLNGCRIGFDAGGSDRKVSAVIDGETVYSEEVIWHPKQSTDLRYQYEGIVESFKTAASKMPRVDAIGVSSAGTFVGNAPMVCSLFIKIPRKYREDVKIATHADITDEGQTVKIKEPEPTPTPEPTPEPEKPTITPTPVNPTTPSNPLTPSTPSTGKGTTTISAQPVKTGDNSRILLYLILMIAAGGAGVIAAKFRNRK